MNQKKLLLVTFALFCISGCDDKSLSSNCIKDEQKCESDTLYKCTEELDDLYWKPNQICVNGCDGNKCREKRDDCGTDKYNEDGSCKKAPYCAIGWNADGTCVAEKGCILGNNADGTCNKQTDCNNGYDGDEQWNTDGTCKAKEGCAIGNDIDGSCLLAQGCVTLQNVAEHNEDGTCRITAICQNGYNPDGTCFCDTERCEQGCDAKGLCKCVSNTLCTYGCDADDKCLCPPKCTNGCYLDESINALECCPSHCKYGCDDQGDCIKSSLCIIEKYNLDGTCANPDCVDQKTVQEDGSCYCPAACQHGCYTSTGRCVVPQGCETNTECNKIAENDSNNAKNYCKDGYCICTDNLCVRLDANQNHLPDWQEHTQNPKYNSSCKTDKDCVDESCTGDNCELFCDSAIGYLCATKCHQDSDCTDCNTEGDVCPPKTGAILVDGQEIEYKYVCRDDGRCAPDTFISTWTTDNANETIRLPKGEMCENVSIDWGDGTDVKQWECLDDIEHTYAKKGKYTVQVKGKYEGFALSEVAYVLNFATKNNKKQKMTVHLPEMGDDISCQFNFYSLKGKTSIDSTAALSYNGRVTTCSDLTKKEFVCTTCNQVLLIITGKPEDIIKLFEREYYKKIDLSADSNLSVNAWTSTVVHVPDSLKIENSSINFKNYQIKLSEIYTFGQIKLSAGAFSRAKKFGYIADVDVPMFYTGIADENSLNNYKRLSNAGWYLFAYVSDANKNKNTNYQISKWDVSNITDMTSMFNSAYINNDIDLTNWNVSNVLGMRSMFTSSIYFNQNISKWNVEKVKRIDSMFSGTDKTRTPFNQNLSEWNVKSVTNASNMFQYSSVSNDQLIGCETIQAWGDINSYFTSRDIVNIVFGKDSGNIQNCVIKSAE